MPVIVNPKYRWLNSLLACVYSLAAIVQFSQAALSVSAAFNLALGSLLAFLAISIFRVSPWSYLAAFILALFSVVGTLKNLDSLGLYAFIALPFAIGTAWSAIFLRQNLLVPVSAHQDS